MFFTAARQVVTAPIQAVQAVGHATMYTLHSCRSSLRFKFALPNKADLRHCWCVAVAAAPRSRPCRCVRPAAVAGPCL
jgi:hypothetical protein